MAAAGFAIFLLGLIFVIAAPINKRKNARCSAQAQGVLIDIWRRRRGLTYLFAYHVNGTDYHLKSTTGGTEAHNPGDPCTIWYNPAKPQEAQPFRYESARIYTILFIAGIAMVLLGMILTVIGIASSV
ncbi:MAG: DUF3592 domain-containing protein [Solobacterium sp.]|nr:DUF3592 domain-containing protein [Solobacterium sp.]